MLQTVWAFLLVLGVLIFVHELGHFLVARWFGVRVLTFSLGFGPKILKWTRDGTVYCVSAIPLGGYVKMAGETTQDERVGAPDEFMSKSRWVRFLVYLAGPAMNIFLAVAAMTIVLSNGADVPLYNSAPAVIGELDPQSVAAKVGMQPGDRIVAIDGRDVLTWDDMSLAVLPKANRSIAVVVDRQGKRQTMTVVPSAETKYEFGTLGVGPVQRPQVVDVQADKPAARGGLERGDVVLAIDGDRAPSRDSIIEVLQKSTDKPVQFEVERKGATVTLAVTPVCWSSLFRTLTARNHSRAPRSAINTSVTTMGTQFVRRSGSVGGRTSVACAGGRSRTWVAPAGSSGVASTGSPRLARSRSARISSADW